VLLTDYGFRADDVSVAVVVAMVVALVVAVSMSVVWRGLACMPGVCSVTNMVHSYASSPSTVAAPLGCYFVVFVKT